MFSNFVPSRGALFWFFQVLRMEIPQFSMQKFIIFWEFKAMRIIYEATNVHDWHCELSFANIVTVHNIPPALCLAADEQFSAILPGGKWTMAGKGQTQVDLVALDNKRGITLIPQFTYQGTTTQCHPDVEFPEGYVTSHSKNHGGTEQTCIEITGQPFHKYCVHTTKTRAVTRAMGTPSLGCF